MPEMKSTKYGNDKKKTIPNSENFLLSLLYQVNMLKDINYFGEIVFEQ